jgi:hypothetical protein
MKLLNCLNLSMVVILTVSANVLGLCEGGEIEVQMFILAQMLIRIPMFKISTNAPLLQNPCACCTTPQTFKITINYLKHKTYKIFI